MTGFQINPPNCAMVDNRGMVTPEWYRFFVKIQAMLGGPSDPFSDLYFATSLASSQAASEDTFRPVSPPIPAEDVLIPPAMVALVSDDLLYPPRYGV